MRCKTCAETGTHGGYCAPLRCYCGHEDCPAFGSYVDLRSQRAGGLREAQKSTNHHAKSWAERGEETWLERL